MEVEIVDEEAGAELNATECANIEQPQGKPRRTPMCLQNFYF